MSHFWSFLAGLPIFVASVALFILMGLTFCDVLFRSLFNAPIEAATEVTRLLMAVIVFSVLPQVSVQKKHIAVDLCDGLFQFLRLERLRDGVLFLICGVLMVWPAWRVLVLAERARDYGDVTEYLGIPTFWVGWFIALTLGATALALLVHGLRTLLSRACEPDAGGTP